MPRAKRRSPHVLEFSGRQARRQESEHSASDLFSNDPGSGLTASSMRSGMRFDFSQPTASQPRSFVRHA